MNTTNLELKTDISRCEHCSCKLDHLDTVVTGVDHEGTDKDVGICCLDQLDIMFAASIYRDTRNPDYKEIFHFYERST